MDLSPWVLSNPSRDAVPHRIQYLCPIATTSPKLLKPALSYVNPIFSCYTPELDFAALVGMTETHNQLSEVDHL